MIRYLFLVMCISSFAFAEARQRTSTIGVVVALTGPLSTVGVTIKNAFELAQRTYDPEATVRFVFEDDGFQAKETVTAVKKLISSTKLDALVVFGASTSLSVASIAERSEIPMVGITVLESLTRDKKYILRFLASTGSLSARTVEEVKLRGIKDLALIATIQDATLEQRDHFRANSPARIVFDQEFLPGELDFRTSVSQIVRINPSAVHTILLPPQGAQFAKQLRTAGYKGQIIGSLQIGAASELRNGGEALYGAWFVTGDDRDAEGFYSAYRKEFPKDPPFAETAYAYALGHLLIEASRSDNINHFLHTAKDVPTAVGRLSADGNNSFLFGVVTKEISELGAAVSTQKSLTN